MKVYIPTALRSYTGKLSVIEADGATVAEALAEIDRRYLGFRFRIVDEQDDIRRHIKIFINETPVSSLAATTKPSDAIHIICALSGGI